MPADVFERLRKLFRNFRINNFRSRDKTSASTWQASPHVLDDETMSFGCLRKFLSVCGSCLETSAAGIKLPQAPGKYPHMY